MKKHQTAWWLMLTFQTASCIWYWSETATTLSIFGKTISFHLVVWAFFATFISLHRICQILYFCLLFGDFSILLKAFSLFLMDMNRHLTQLARKGGNPMDFKFVEHHKVCLVHYPFFQLWLNNKRSSNYFDGSVCLVPIF